MTEILRRDASLAFLGRFLLVSTLLSLAWEPLAGHYLATLLPAVNALLETGAVSIRLVWEADRVHMVIRNPDGGLQYLRFSGYQLLHLHAVAGTALFAATPTLTRGDRARWIGVLLALFWLSQVWMLYEGALLGLAEYWERLPADRRAGMLESGWPGDLFAAAGGRLYAWWNMWGGPSLVLVLWIVAVQGYVLPGGDSGGEPTATAVEDDLA